MMLISSPPLGPFSLFHSGARLGVDDEGQRVAMPQAEDFRPVAGAAHERIVWRNGAVVAKPQDLAAQTGGVLRDLADIAAGRHVDHAVAPEDDAAVEARVAFKGVRHQEIADVGERAAFEPAASERWCAFAVFDRLGVGEVDESIVGESADGARHP